MSEELGIQLQIIGLLTLLAIYGWFKASNELALWRTRGEGGIRPSLQPAEGAQQNAPPQYIDPTPFPGVARALLNPPQRLDAVLDAVRRLYPDERTSAAEPDTRYILPIGWKASNDGTRGVIVAVNLVGECYHALITAQTRAGKDNFLAVAALALAYQQSPEQLQFCFIDGKGLDYEVWRDRAHAWRVASDEDEVVPAMEALTAERQRRRGILRRAGLVRWEDYTGRNLPLLVVIVSELRELETAAGKQDFTKWMNRELAASAAYGIRYVIANQSASNFDTAWRTQVNLYIAGYQPDPTQDKPNTGRTTAQLRDMGAVPPSELPAPTRGPGLFTAVQDDQAFTLRVSYLDGKARAGLVERLPHKTQTEHRALVADRITFHEQLHDPKNGSTAVTASSDEDGTPVTELLSNHDTGKASRVDATPGSNAPTVTEQPTATPNAVVVPPEEAAQIRALAAAGVSRKKIAMQLYRSLSKYDRITAVLGPANGDGGATAA